MLFDLESIYEEFKRAHKYAAALKVKFKSSDKTDELSADCQNLASICNHLLNLLPEEIRDKTRLKRHLAWMEKWSNEGEIYKCQSDVEDICEQDLNELEGILREWLQKGEYYDRELGRAVEKLFNQLEFDSAIRKSFVVLTNRLRKKFHLSGKLDGLVLVNEIFGSNGVLRESVDRNELQSMRDLLAGLYGVFRNKYAHGKLEASWLEANAIVSTINIVLKILRNYKRPIGSRKGKQRE